MRDKRKRGIRDGRDKGSGEVRDGRDKRSGVKEMRQEKRVERERREKGEGQRSKCER